MKTFKAVRFQIVNEHGRIIEYELEDGVIINKGKWHGLAA